LADIRPSDELPSFPLREGCGIYDLLSP